MCREVFVVCMYADYFFLLYRRKVVFSTYVCQAFVIRMIKLHRTYDQASSYVCLSVY